MLLQHCNACLQHMRSQTMYDSMETKLNHVMLHVGTCHGRRCGKNMKHAGSKNYRPSSHTVASKCCLAWRLTLCCLGHGQMRLWEAVGQWQQAAKHSCDLHQWGLPVAIHHSPTHLRCSRQQGGAGLVIQGGSSALFPRAQMAKPCANTKCCSACDAGQFHGS